MNRPAFLSRRRLLLGGFLLVVAAATLWLAALATKYPGSETAPYDGPLVEAGGRYLTLPPQEGEISLFVAGDAILVQPWSQVSDPRFLSLIEEMRAADAAIVNLEQLIHDFRGYAQADAGGTWLRAAPEIAEELAWAGVDLLPHANNHSFDYGSIGILETHDNARSAGLLLAGSGRDLQAARAPAYFNHPKGRVALVSMASTFVPYGRASRSRSDHQGRPGLNPLSLRSDVQLRLTRESADRLVGLARFLGYSGKRFKPASFDIFGIPFEVGDRHGLDWGTRIVESDREGNLASIREAAANAGLVVVSIHAHDQGAWLEAFARQAVDAGADVVFVQGPHVMHGIELYAGKPILYCLGDFAYQTHLLDRLPADYFEMLGLGDEATPQQAMATRAAFEGDYAAKRAIWEGVGAVLRFRDGRLIELRLLPLDLGFGKVREERGRPRLATGTLAREIISFIAAKSQTYGTTIRYAAGPEFGVVELN